MPTSPMSSTENSTLDSDRLFHSFHRKYPIPVPPTSISAATITSHAIPIEMRMPVTMVGAAAGRITVSARRRGGTSSVRATLSQSRRTAATPNTVLISMGHTEQIKITNTAEVDELLIV